MRFILTCLLAFSFLIQDSSLGHRPHLFGIAHVAFHVGNINRTESFYENILGYQQPFLLDDEQDKPTIGFVKVNDFQYVELFRGDEQAPGQLDHFALYTDNLTAMSAYLHALGMYIAKDIHKGRTGNPFLTIRDPDGHFVEIVQYASNSMTAQSQGKFMSVSRVSDHISHVGIVINSVDLAMKFYRDALGFREFARGGGTEGHPGWIELQLPDGGDYIKLIISSGATVPTNPKSENYMGLASADVRRAADVLRSRTKVSLNISVSAQNRNGLPAHLDLVDPDGAHIEIAEPIGAGSMQHPMHSQ